MIDITNALLMHSNVGIDGATRTNKTIIDYIKRGHQMWCRASKDLLVDTCEMTSWKFLTWLECKLPRLRPTTRRQYIASIRCMFEAMYQQAVDDHERHELMASLNYANDMKSEKYNPVEPLKKQWRGATSSQKSKKFSNKELVLFVSEVKKLKWKWAECAAVWITANRIVGLRPSEWRSVVLMNDGSRVVLEVRNGKHSNGRANGELRHIDITDLRKEELALIKRQLLFVAQYSNEDADWNSYYSGVRQAIYGIVRLMLGNQRKYPSLYSSRHQFSADAKASGMSKKEIAALMGHSTDETATVHYGKKKFGLGGCCVKPDADEVATVRVKVDKNLHKSIRI